MNKRVTIPYGLDEAETAAVNLSILADGLARIFDMNGVAMSRLDDETKSEWFLQHYDLLNGGLSVISNLTETICAVLGEVNASRVIE